MDVLVLIDKLDDLVHNAKAVPLTDQVRIDREEIYDILDQMRATIPEEIKQARWIVKERQEMLAEAKREVDRLLAEAREQAVREASQTEIVKIAERQADEIVEDARRSAREMKIEMEDWADNQLASLEVNLERFLTAVRRGRERLHERSQETVVAGLGANGDISRRRRAFRLARGELVRELDEGLRRLRAVAVAVPASTIVRGGIREPNGSMTARSRGSTTSRGSIAAPRPSATSACQRAVVVGAEDDVELGDAAGQKPFGLVGTAAPDQRQLRDLAERRRRVERGELGLGRDEQDVGILQQLGPLERAVAQRQLGERQVELAVLEQAEQVGRVALLAHADADARPLRAKAPDEGGEEARADALVDADAERPGLAFGERGHVRAGGVELRDDRVGVS